MEETAIIEGFRSRIKELEEELSDSRKVCNGLLAKDLDSSAVARDRVEELEAERDDLMKRLLRSEDKYLLAVQESLITQNTIADLQAERDAQRDQLEQQIQVMQRSVDRKHERVGELIAENTLMRNALQDIADSVDYAPMGMILTIRDLLARIPEAK